MAKGNETEGKKCHTHMEKLEMKAESGRFTSKAASLVMDSWFHTELVTVVKA